MVDSQKIRFLNEVVSKSRPQNVDYTPHNGRFCVLLLALQPIDWVSVQQRDFKLTGELKENESLSVTLIVGSEALFSISDLPYVAPQGDRTPISRFSVLPFVVRVGHCVCLICTAIYAKSIKISLW